MRSAGDVVVGPALLTKEKMASEKDDIASLESRLDSFLKALGPLCTISSVGRAVLEILAEDLTPSEKLKSIVRYDPILTAAVLSEAATHPKKPLNIEQAWQILPQAQILSTVLKTAVVSINVQAESIDRAKLWRHSLAVALISRAAAQRSSRDLDPQNPAINQSEVAYTAGLVHDLAKLQLSSAMPKSLSRAWQLVRAEGEDLLEAERRVFDFNHTSLGQRMARNLHLPSILVKSIWLHHHSWQTLGEGSYLPLVVFADNFARQLGLGESGNLDLSCEATELAEQIGLDSECLRELSQSIPQELDDAVRVLGLDEPAEPQRSIEALTEVVSNITGLHGELKEEFAQQLTELREAEAMSRQFAEIMRQGAGKFERKTLDAKLAEVAVGAAHELNNPLTVIAGRSQLLAKQETDPKKKEDLELIGSQARQACEIASELLRAVQPPKPSPTPTQLEPIIRRLCAALAGKAQSSGGEVICELPKHFPDVVIDAEMFEQSLLEILKNALTALGEKPGTILVRGRVDEAQEKVSLEVADSGIGMDAAVARNAFVPFFSFARAGRGRGLGLTRARAFIEANQGRLWLRSHPGKGTTVWMSVPLAKNG